MIIAVGSRKGGVSKTSIAVSLAVDIARSRKVLLIDTDGSQQTAVKWSQTRESRGLDSSNIDVFAKSGNLKETLQKAASKYDYVIVDLGGYDSTSLRSCLLVADVFVHCLRPSSFDIQTVEETYTLLIDAQTLNESLTVYTVLTQTATNSKIELKEARKILKDLQRINLIDSAIPSRKAWRDIGSTGAGITELKDNKAVLEFKNFMREVIHADQS